MICIIASAGGHLTEALKAVELVATPKYIVTFSLPHLKASLKGHEYYYIVDPHISKVKYLINLFQSLVLFLKKRPKVIVTTGSGIAIFTCLIGKLFGSKIIFIETGARIETPSKTGKFMYRISDLFIVQWKPLLKHFPRAVYGGTLL